ncbi:carboxypeptidase-like regulatory domain-containing protein [Flaviramulus sp. BrNp1-15]|uniref:carboxypeptidase-like regulatory domain-containing protein n=1 Tax=Flaviramulus sp. BrNp1-15 TaxID=2916754 RepID=UPI001EE9930C|nr:carboxypeptidase-like regulatory domain-containing protein [Flaviramulus sp. BrNp1-15]ULC58480.1 carboxypeptidase-like regulatory domain-containing protein [Flaviramulus sp. BrNp1-15]
MKQFNLTIGKPCSEKFNQFTQTNSGGFCNSCQKEVMDFRNMSDEKLVEYFKNNQANTCGYFKTNQLKEYSNLNDNRNEAKFKYLRIIGFALFSALSLHNIQAQEKQPATEIIEQTKEAKSNQVKNNDKQKGLLAGVVSDETGPLPGANIILKGTTIGTSTNFDGEFVFPKKLEKGDILIFSFLGYETQTIEIKENQNILNVNMGGDDSFVLMGEVEVNEVYKSKRTLWQKIKDIF